MDWIDIVFALSDDQFARIASARQQRESAAAANLPNTAREIVAHTRAALGADESFERREQLNACRARTKALLDDIDPTCGF